MKLQKNKNQEIEDLRAEIDRYKTELDHYKKVVSIQNIIHDIPENLTISATEILKTINNMYAYILLTKQPFMWDSFLYFLDKLEEKITTQIKKDESNE